MKFEDINKKLSWLPQRKDGIEARFDFLNYYCELRNMGYGNWHGLGQPYSKRDCWGIFPILWIAEIGQYTEEEVRGYVDGLSFKTVQVRGEKCIYHLIPIGNFSLKLLAEQERELKRQKRKILKIKVDTTK
jgi:hypothetical protein